MLDAASHTQFFRPPTDRPTRLVVLVSGGGSNLAALLAACQQPDYGAQVVAVGADRHDCGGQKLADDAGIASFVVRVSDFATRAAWDAALTQQVQAAAPDIVISAGFLKLVGPQFLAAFPGRFFNTHNSLLPAFAGVNGPADALAYGVKLAGATLFVVDAGVDTGPIIAQVAVPVASGDSVDELTERIKVAERAQLVRTVGQIARSGYTITGRTVTIP